MRLTHPGAKDAVETTDDLAAPYLRQGWSENDAPARKSRKKAARDSTDSTDSGVYPTPPTTEGEQDGD